MAKFKFSPLVESARGKFGNAVFSANKSGAYMRQLVQPRNPSTGKQGAVRATFGQIARAWRALTEAQREAWKQYATQFSQTDVLGQNVVLSGFQLFTKLNNSLQQIGAPGLEMPGGSPEFSPYGFQVEVGPEGPYINNYDADMTDDDNIAVVYSVAGPFSAGRSVVSDSEYRIAEVMPQLRMAAFPMNPTRVGINTNIPAGTSAKFFIKIEQVHRPTGWRSTPQVFDTLVER